LAKFHPVNPPEGFLALVGVSVKSIILAPHTPILAEWQDSATLPGWRHPHSDHAPTRVNTLGYVVRADRHALTITTSLSGEGLALDPITIPWGSIEACRKVRL